MCGIAGYVGAHGFGPAAEAILAKMGETIAHRGPDGSGIFHGETAQGGTEIGLVHRRLAIIDLAGGHQPMHDAAGTRVLVFNGEIYNFVDLRVELEGLGHVFRTSSDTEVLLAAYGQWGVECLSRLRGMFAFALWDGVAETLFLARDRFGKKPLYLHEQGGDLIFASEIKAILAHPAARAELDRDSVWDYLGYRYVPGPWTLFKGIRKLAPGGYALWRRGQLEERIWYVPPDSHRRPNGLDLDDPVAAFAEKLDECVRVRMVSDVPFGAFLSGGVDSSAIVALMSRHSNQPVKTFSVGYAEAPRYNEVSYARMVAEQFGTDHDELTIAAEDMMDWLPRLIRFRDAPVSEPADIPIYLLAKEASRSVKMVLTGEGSDEFLGGYPKHRFEPLVSTYQRLVPGGVHRRLVAPMISALPYRFRRVKTLAASAGLRDPRERMPRWFGALALHERSDLTALPETARAQEERPFTVVAGQTSLRRILHFDQTSWLPDNLLERGDRMTMAASIEARMPFMDHELAEFVARLPDRYRIQAGEQKWVLRRAMEKVLPAPILNRPKVGFRVPVNEWFRGKMRSYVRDLLTGPDSLTRDYYHAVELDRILDDHACGRQNYEKLIWTLVALELFQREYRLA